MTSKMVHISEGGCPVCHRCLRLTSDLTQVQVFCIAAHTIYGIPLTINSANYQYFLAYQDLRSLRNGYSSVPRKDTKSGALVNGIIYPVQDSVPTKALVDAHANDIEDIVTSAFDLLRLAPSHTRFWFYRRDYFPSPRAGPGHLLAG